MSTKLKFRCLTRNPDADADADAAWKALEGLLNERIEALEKEREEIHLSTQAKIDQARFNAKQN